TYKVQLKENNYPFDQYIDDKYVVIASLIDKFIVDYSYVNTFSSELDYKVKYNVIADLAVYDSDNEVKPVYTKNYTLIDNQEITGHGLMAKIDLLNNDLYYDSYNEIVNQLKKEIIPSAVLTVRFNTEFTGTTDKLADKIKSTKTSTLTIPISRKIINVDIKKNGASKEEEVYGKKNLRKGSVLLIISTVILLVILVIKYISYALKTAKKKTKYEQALNKILREFDRAITEAKGRLRVDKKSNTIEVKDFMELLDVHDNFNIPIIHYRISKYMSVFIVKNNDDIYYSIMKSDDYE
ncbi:MAG: DUF5305 domain-containing protein, partial [Bacilli bacterium]|nr:DUF5305 domain-containing protein [Bacilli bacterium]